ncbi:DUF2508 family protein [Defluviitalea raffinosedens]|uniref:DUF2508 family protein n=1 Tax=Defluviitalea raffinosedens TaxID=1450156 RepID=UPI00131A83BF|nr:DUF2508 family protein [Defluviitalea raffinosedens]
MNSIIEISKKGFFSFKFKTRQTCHITEEDELKEELLKTKRQIDLVFNAFENTTEKDLIDSCIYEMKALQTRYKYYLNKMKEKENVAVKS